MGFNENYLPIWLRDAGYKTYYTGKLYNGMDEQLVEKKTAKGWTKAVGFSKWSCHSWTRRRHREARRKARLTRRYATRW